MKSFRRYLQPWPAILSSAGIFWFVLAFFVFEAAWIAFSAVYPMAFDEDFHLGIIRLYGHHLSPFWSHQPAGADSLGAVYRDPSYLYHYLMSFPYRLINVFTHNQAAQVVILRMVNIGLFVWSLVLFRRLLFKARAHPALANLSLLVVALVPIAPYLAGQINYDNLVLPLTALSLLLALKLHEGFRVQKLDAATLLKLAVSLLSACLVKYAFLPIAFAITVYILVAGYRARLPFPTLQASWRRLNKWLLLSLTLTLLLISGLFVERYGVNLVKYHTPLPSCGQVLDYDHCKSYGPWLRDYILEQNKHDFKPDLAVYSGEWFKGMWQRSFFAISGPGNDYHNSPPMPVPAYSTIVFLIAGFVILLVTAKRIWQKYYSPALWLFTLVSLVYLGLLWLDEYRAYNRAGTVVAINGRYLLPILPLAIFMTTLAVNELLGQRRRLKGLLVAVVIICLLWGGGALTYILRSPDSWYWPNTPLKPANHAIQDTFGPVTPGYRKP